MPELLPIPDEKSAIAAVFISSGKGDFKLAIKSSRRRASCPSFGVKRCAVRKYLAAVVSNPAACVRSQAAKSQRSPLIGDWPSAFVVERIIRSKMGFRSVPGGASSSQKIGNIIERTV